MRDATRGGVGTMLNEIADIAGVAIAVDEIAVPVRDEVRGACEILGIDPLYVACEGRWWHSSPPRLPPSRLAAMRAHPLGQGGRDHREV